MRNTQQMNGENPKRQAKEDVVLVLNIEIGGTLQEIRVKPNDDPQRIAKEFCTNNNLEPDIEDKIAAYIVNNLPADKKAFKSTENSTHSKSRSHSCRRFNRVQEDPLNTLESCRKNAFEGSSKYSEPKKAKEEYLKCLYEDIVFGKSKCSPKINAKSAEIVRSKSVKGNTSDVFERLSLVDKSAVLPSKTTNNMKSELSKGYTEYTFKTAPCNAVYPRKKNFSSKSVVVNNDKPREKFLANDDIGIRLYRKALETRADKKRFVEFATENCSTRRSLSMSTRWDWLETACRVEDRFERDMAVQKKKRLAEKEKAEAALKKECTFRPKVNQNSVVLARHSKSVCASKSFAEGSELGDVFQTLYSVQRLNGESKPLPAAFTFRPQISNNFHYRKKSDYVRQPVTDRLIQSKGEKEAALRKMKEEKEAKERTVDSKTGQKLYRPKITRGPKKATANASKPFHDRLYKDQYLNSKKIEAEKKAKQRWDEMKNKSYSMQQSEKLLITARKKKCQELFNLLDPDSCGTITASHIRLDYLSSKALEVLEPALIDMENKNLMLNSDTFCTLVEPFLKKLSLTQLRELVAGPKKALDAEIKKNFTFAVLFMPQVSERSQRYATQKRTAFKNPHDLSEKLYQDHKTTKEKIAQRAAEKEEFELGQCTFNPVIHDVDKAVFEKTKEDVIVESYIKRKAKSKERAEVVEELVKKNRMKIY